jgi:PAS domain S-box-containing protein
MREDAHKSQEDIRREHDLLTKLMETSPSGIVVADRSGTIVFANPAAERVLGLERSGTEGRAYNDPAWRITDYDGGPLPGDGLPFRIIIEAGEPVYGLRNALVWPDGRQVLLLINGAPLFEESGKIERVVFSIEDVTKQIRVDSALRDSEERFRRMADSIREGLAIIERGKVVYVNDRLCEITGYSRDELMNMSEFDLAAPSERERIDGIKHRMENEGYQPGELEYWIVRKDGRMRSIYNRYSPNMTAGKVTGRYVITSDVTERKRIEEQLMQSQKMEAIGNLAGGVAHDFNNILTAISGYAEILLNTTGSEDPRREDIGEIQMAAERATALTRQLLVFSRSQVLEPRILDINEVISLMGKMLGRIIGEDIKLVLELEPALGSVLADPGQIEQVIMNLSVNARDAMPDGGTLGIRTMNVTLDEQMCREIPDTNPGAYICLEIRDTGSGMERELLDRIFEPFFSTKESGRGTGLGLSTVYGIIKQHKGSITVWSEPGSGSVFRIYLPVHGESQDRSDEDAISAEALRGSGERVLLVEDDDEVRRFSARVLTENNYRVSEAGTAEEAVEIFRNEGGGFDLILSDIVLPDRSALQMIDELSPEKSHIRVVLISGYADYKVRWSEIEDRGFAFLQKPFTIIDLLRSAREAVRGEDN